MKSVAKAVLAAGATTIFMAIWPFSGEAQAEPVMSSWYGPGLEGNPTASGEIFRADARTAAHPNLPFGTKLLVTYGGHQTVVRVTDRGPFVGGRGLDLSRGAAEEIGLTAAGADAVDVRVLGDSADNERLSSNSNSSSSKGDHDGVAAFLRERPYLRILGAVFTSHSKPQTRTCQEASMTAPTPIAGTRLPSVEYTRARVVSAGARC
jgi:rare lipoprotein A